MDESKLLSQLGQASCSEAAIVFRDYLRGCVRQMLSDVMAAEVTELCGSKHAPNGSDCFRAGSSPGRILHEGQREEVVRPRVRRKRTNGSTSEVSLASYESANNPDELRGSIVNALISGVSSREVRQTHPKSPGVGRSNVSRLWQSVGHKFVDALRGKDLSAHDWVVMMIDGIRLSPEQTAVVAIAITATGEKHVLDFELGSSENTEVCRGLLRRLEQRGFRCKRRLFAVLDGSQALRTALVEYHPDALVQRCLVHKERNIRGRLSKKHWGELSRLFKRLRSVQSQAAAQEVVAELIVFLEPKNAEALKSLLEAGDDLIALQSLNVPNTLHRNLLSTNAIENSFRNTRKKLGRVTRFRAETDQATRWLAYALTEAEKGFRRISGYADLPKLITALEKSQSTPPKIPTGLQRGDSNEIENG
jgi:transposase-like protein